MTHSYSWPREPLKVSVVKASAAPAELISLEDAKAFLRVTANTDDDLITSLIKAAREYAEKRTGRSLVKKDYVLSLNRFPNLYCDWTTAIELRFPPLAAVDRIEYVDLDNTQQVLQNSEFQVDLSSEPGRVAPLTGRCWPATLWGLLSAVRVFYSAGYDAPETFPDDQNQTVVSVNSQVSGVNINREILEDLITAMKQLIVHWYQNRDVVIAMPGAGGVYAPLPIHLDQIIDQHRLMNLALTF